MKTLYLVLIGVLSCQIAWAVPEFTEQNIIKAVAGEAGGQGIDEIIAHCQAIANRGSLEGVYGYRAKVSVASLKRANAGLLASKSSPDLVNGADHWLSDYDLEHSRESLIAWRHKAVYSVKVGSTRFYRLK